jgi:1-acyl-sn-glycerol-3-phosphate acyltransferase
MRSYLKVTAIIPFLTAYVFVACIIAILPSGARLRRTFLIRNTAFFSRLILMVLNIRIHIKHRDRKQTAQGALLIVANHVSYIDVLIIAALAPSVFVTSVELGSTLFLGMLARLGGSMFVERRRPSGLKKEITTISNVLGEGFSVSLFPEGTTSNGEQVQLFKIPLFDAAIAANADVLPICLRYTRVNKRPLSPRNRDSVFYYGGTKFFEHIPRLLSLASIDVDVELLKLIRTRGDVTRKEVAAQAYAAISSAYHR